MSIRPKTFHILKYEMKWNPIMRIETLNWNWIYKSNTPGTLLTPHTSNLPVVLTRVRRLRFGWELAQHWTGWISLFASLSADWLIVNSHLLLSLLTPEKQGRGTQEILIKYYWRFSSVLFWKWYCNNKNSSLLIPLQPTLVFI